MAQNFLLKMLPPDLKVEMCDATAAAGSNGQGPNINEIFLALSNSAVKYSSCNHNWI
jgi:hypothetical protein